MSVRDGERVEFFATVDSDSCRPWMPDNVSYLLPASSFARVGFRRPNLPPQVRRVAADCGGYVATKRWGDYPYSPATYVEWLERWPIAPAWAATMDYCCEEDIATDRAVIRSRQEQTTASAYFFWHRYGDAPWAWVPTLQGWEPDDYLEHARALGPLIRRQQAVYARHPSLGSEYRVGIGTLCRRASAQQIAAIVAALTEELPGVRFHLWGVKLSALWRSLPRSVVSIDSAAWNGRFGRDLQLQKRSDLTQRRYSYQVALPAYLRKVDQALGQTRPPATPAASTPASRADLEVRPWGSGGSVLWTPNDPRGRASSALPWSKPRR